MTHSYHLGTQSRCRGNQYRDCCSGLAEVDLGYQARGRGDQPCSATGKQVLLNSISFEQDYSCSVLICFINSKNLPPNKPNKSLPTKALHLCNNLVNKRLGCHIISIRLHLFNSLLVFSIPSKQILKPIENSLLFLNFNHLNLLLLGR